MEKTHPNSCLQLRIGSWKVLSTLDSLLDASVDGVPVRPAEHCAGAEQGQWIILGTGVVDGNVPKHVLADLLGQVNVDAQKVGYVEGFAMSTIISSR